MKEVNLFPGSIKLSDLKKAKHIAKTMQEDTFCKVVVDKKNLFRSYLSLNTQYHTVIFKTFAVTPVVLLVFCLSENSPLLKDGNNS